MTTYHLDLTTGEATQLGPTSASAAYTDDAYFIDPETLKDPDVRRSLGDIYAALRSRRFVKQPAAGEPSTSRT